MNRVSTLIIGALFAIAAVEFGLLGASAAGLTGGNDNSLPPVSERLGVVETPTPLPATGIGLSAPPSVGCYANAFAAVNAFVVTAGGQPVVDGTEVVFSVSPQGTANPAVATTFAGSASTYIFPGFTSGNITVLATSGLAEATVSIPCELATPTMPSFVTVTPTPSPTPCDGLCPPTFTATATWTPGPQGTNTPCAQCPTATPQQLSPPSCDTEVEFCPTVVPNTPIPPISPPQLSPPSVDATGMDIRANPLTIECDGYDSSTVTVRIFDANGDPVPDGTYVSFSPYNGNADPWFGYTYDGFATTQVSFYGDIFPYGPNLIVESGLLQAGIRIRCNPQSDACPLSPPIDSPPCGEPTPYPCNPSPGSDPLSPPCEPEPPCALSPPSVSPPCEPEPPCALSPPSVSPPCEEPTPPVSPPSAAFELAVDCDVFAPGVQWNCEVQTGAAYDVAIVAFNRSGYDTALGAFGFTANNPDRQVLTPLDGADVNLEGNPDFNQAHLGTDFACLPPVPSSDTIPDDAGSTSRLGCFNFPPGPPPTFPDGTFLTVATVHYIASAPGFVPISLEEAFLADAPSFASLGYCNPTADGVEMLCTAAYVSVFDPVGETPFEFAIDCDTTVAGVQDACIAAPNTAKDVDLVITNKSGADVSFAAIGSNILNSSTAALNPLSGTIDVIGVDGNPDFNQAFFDQPGWQCSPPSPSPDIDPGGPSSDSYIGCFNGSSPVQVVADGATVTFATVHYQSGASGATAISIHDGNLYDQNFGELGTCRVTIGVHMNCDGATVTVEDGGSTGPPTTPTTAATNTSVPTATLVPTQTPVPPTATIAPSQTPVPAATTAPTNTPHPPTATAPASTPTRPARTATVPPRTATVAPTRTPTRGNRCADVNDDGRVTRADIREILRRVHNGPYIAKYDINRSGKLGNGDVIAAMRQLGRRC